jgi:Na+/melibiose symporter-like transporter
VAEVVNGATRLIDQSQPAGFMLALRILFVIVPLVLLGLAIFFAARLPITPETHARLGNFLSARRANPQLTLELQAEETELKKLLI